MTKKVLTQTLLKNQALRFIISAGAGFLVDVSVFRLFNKHLLTKPTYKVFSLMVSNYAISLSISYFLGVIVNFLITRYMVFNESKLAPQKQFIRFISVAIIGFFANLLIVKILIEFYRFDPTYARVTAALSLFFASYFIHKAFSFSLSLRRHNAN